jgi:hypothetical protein
VDEMQTKPSLDAQRSRTHSDFMKKGSSTSTPILEQWRHRLSVPDSQSSSLQSISSNDEDESTTVIYDSLSSMTSGERLISDTNAYSLLHLKSRKSVLCFSE